MSASSTNLTGGKWEFFNVNLIIKDCHLKNYKLVFSNNLKYRNNETINGFNLTFINTYYSYPEYIGGNPLIQIINSNALFVNTTITHFHPNDNGAIIFATLNSQLKMSHCNVSEIVGMVQLVNIFNFSIIHHRKM